MSSEPGHFVSNCGQLDHNPQAHIGKECACDGKSADEIMDTIANVG